MIKGVYTAHLRFHVRLAVCETLVTIKFNKIVHTNLHAIRKVASRYIYQIINAPLIYIVGIFMAHHFLWMT